MSKLKVSHGTEFIVLRPGESVIRCCGKHFTRTFTKKIHCKEALVVICKKSGRRFVFICGPSIDKVRTVSLPKKSLIVVKCVR